MISFRKFLEAKEEEEEKKNSKVLIGALYAMRQLFQTMGNNLLDEYFPNHRGRLGEFGQMLLSANPDLLITFDPNNQVFARGSHHCLNFQFLAVNFQLNFVVGAFLLVKRHLRVGYW